MVIDCRRLFIAFSYIVYCSLFLVSFVILLLFFLFFVNKISSKLFEFANKNQLLLGHERTTVVKHFMRCVEEGGMSGVGVKTQLIPITKSCVYVWEGRRKTESYQKHVAKGE